MVRFGGPDARGRMGLGPIRPRPVFRCGGFRMAASDQVVKVGTARRASTSKKSIKEAEQRLKQAQRASILLKQVSDPTRLQVVLMLSEGEKHVGGLCEQLSQSQPAVSHHLALLRHGGIIAPRRQGKNNFYGLTDTGAELASVVKGILA